MKEPWTVKDVWEAQRTPAGCCDRHADNSWCDCLERSVDYDFPKTGASVAGACHLCDGDGEILVLVGRHGGLNAYRRTPCPRCVQNPAPGAG